MTERLDKIEHEFFAAARYGEEQAKIVALRYFHELMSLARMRMSAVFEPLPPVGGSQEARSFRIPNVVDHKITPDTLHELRCECGERLSMVGMWTWPIGVVEVRLECSEGHQWAMRGALDWGVRVYVKRIEGQSA